VPHTWQIEAPLANYRGIAWYLKTFDAPQILNGNTCRIEFEAVFHSASVWINGKFAGEHLRKGYTAFTLDITPLLIRGGLNTIAVRVDNSFNEHMLPRGRSSDWAHDGGIYRPVQLLITPQLFVDRIDVDALPDSSGDLAMLNIVAFVQNASAETQNIKLSYQVIDDATRLSVLSNGFSEQLELTSRSQAAAHTSATLSQPKLWHFDSPHLYRLEVTAYSTEYSHSCSTTFGVRRFEVSDTAFYLNGEKVRLMGVERMAGSNPEYGMAESRGWIEHDHDDLKHLNCVFTRVHWPQDRRVLDYCDRQGILIQTEVPTWGPDTFKSMGEQPDADIMQNGLEQLREMVGRDRNHPCIGSWGLCNEIGGQHAPAYNFAKNMLAESKRIDPNRLCSYASHSLFKTPEKDVSGLMDFISCNEYFGSWQTGGPADLAQMIDNVHAAFPDKPIVISEYGYCACTADRPEGDQHREYVMRSQDEIFRQRDYVAGLIFFCYNDYRTHVGDRGLGVMQQRVHGVVDLFGRPKPSYKLLRSESSPIESLVITGAPKHFEITVQSRAHVPGYTLRGYKLRGVLYGYGDIPVEQQEVSIPELKPGDKVTLAISFVDAMPVRVELDVIRPTGFSTFSYHWSA
jgi:beta-glucuronidase